MDLTLTGSGLENQGDDDYVYPNSDYSSCDWSVSEILEGFTERYGEHFDYGIEIYLLIISLKHSEL